MTNKLLKEFIIPPKQAQAFSVGKGQSFRVTDIEGQQVGDLVMINEHDHSEKINPSYTRQWVSTWDPENMLVRSMFQGITVGNEIISTVRQVMATITADTPKPSGTHDLLMRSCSRWIYEEAAKAGMGSPQDGCLELLAGALAPYGFSIGDVPDDFNIFMNVQYDMAEKMFIIREPVSKAGDYIEFRAEMDLLCALSACPDDVCSQCNGLSPHPAKPLQVQVFV